MIKKIYETFGYNNVIIEYREKVYQETNTVDLYFNIIEGKITKINLTNSDDNGADLFDQTTLFNLNADTDNARYSYFSMDAGIGQTTRDFWLFGGTGNFNDIGGGSKFMDNILYSVKDPNYPYFVKLNGAHVPRETVISILSEQDK